MKIKLFIVLLLSLFSCHVQKDEMKKNLNSEDPHHITILSAEKSQWFGGIEGVKGANFVMVLKNNSNQEYTFDKLVFTEGQELLVEQKKKGDTYELLSNWTAKRVEKTLSLDGEKIEKNTEPQNIGNKAVLFYHTKGKEDSRTIDIAFKNKPLSNENLYP